MGWQETCPGRQRNGSHRIHRDDVHVHRLPPPYWRPRYRVQGSYLRLYRPSAASTLAGTPVYRPPGRESQSFLYWHGRLRGSSSGEMSATRRLSCRPARVAVGGWPARCRAGWTSMPRRLHVTFTLRTRRVRIRPLHL